MPHLAGFVAALFLVLSGCGEKGADPNARYNLGISWNANREVAVNRAGGGYRVYYSTTSGFALSAGTMTDVPFVSGSQAPTSLSITGVKAGKYYVKIVAYSTLNAPGVTTGSVSAESLETPITVP